MSNDNIDISVPIKKDNKVLIWILVIILIGLIVFSVYEYLEIKKYKDTAITTDSEIKMTDATENMDCSNTSPDSSTEDTEITLNGISISSLEKSIDYDDQSVIYNNSIITYDVLSQEERNYLLWEFAQMNMLDDSDMCSQIQSSKYINDTNKALLKVGCSNFDWSFQNEYPDYILDYVYDTNYNQLNETYHKIFGLANDLPKETATFGIDACILKNNDLLCFRGEGGYTDGWYDIRFDSAYIYNDRIELYQYYGESNNVIDGYGSVSDYSDADFKKIAKKYKSIFKKDTNNNFYWYSTQPVTE